MDFFGEVERIALLIAEHGRVSLAGITHDVGGDRELARSVGSELVTRGAATWDGDVLVATADSPASAGDEEEHGELRHVTVMFCDVVDSTRLSTLMDAERWTAAIRSVHRVISDSVEEWGGHVGNYLGDGVIAYFGYPTAREDAAERGVRAGLEILDRMQESPIECGAPDRPLAVRIGLHTGQVVVDEFGGVVQAMGETTNVAARIEGSAPPNGVVVSPATKRLVAGVFVTADLGERELRGVAEPVAITQVIRVGGVAPRLGAGRSARTPLVGRQLELGLLHDRWAQAREGWGQAVILTGEAGIGKSRLVDAFRAAIADDAHSWLDAACSPYSQSSALAPMAELQRRGLGFTASDDPADKAAALEDALADVGLDGARGTALLAELHGLGVADPVVASMSPEHRRTELLALLIDWVVELARLQPTVFFLDDIHWSDPTTIELAGRLIDASATEQLFLVVTARPDRVPDWTARSNLTPIHLARMTREQVEQLAVAVAGTPLPDDTLEAVVRRSDGVPLFAEELAVAVAVAPDGGEVPETLQDLLMARLEHLGPLREIAQTASVVGREFDHADIAPLSPVGPDELARMLDLGVREELFYRRGIGDDATYIFRHALMRDAIYDSMLTPTRQRHHLRYARSLVETRAHDATDLPEVVATHFAAGGETETATVWWERAADHAIDTAAADEAEHFYRAAIESCAAADERRRVDLHLRLAGAMNSSRGYGHADLVGVWDEVIRGGIRLDDDTTLAYGLTGMALGKAIAGDFTTARTELDAGRAAAPTDALEVEVGVGAMETLMLVFEGHPTPCIETADRLSLLEPDRASIARYNRAIGVDVERATDGYRRYALASRGEFVAAHREPRPDAGTAPATYANLLALACGHETMRYEGLVRRSGDSYDEINRELIAFSRHHHLRFFELVGMLPVACADAILSGDARPIADAWSHLAELGGSGSMIAAPMFLFDIARAELACGGADKAVGTAAAGLTLAADTGQHYVDPYLHAVRLEAEFELGTLSETWTDDVDSVMSFARDRSLAAGALSLALAAGRISVGTSEADVAADRLRAAVDAIPEPDDAPMVDDANELLERLVA